METIVYQEEKNIPTGELLALYGDAGWTAYTRDPERLGRAVRISHYVLSARKEGCLVGLLRIVGDGETIIYIQDILVLKTYQRKGVGSALLKQALTRFEDVRQKVLLTDDQAQTKGFYKASGFEECGNKGLKCFVRIG